MKKLSQRQLHIVEIVKRIQPASFRAIFSELHAISERTVKRELAELVECGVLETHGAGRALAYTITSQGRFFLPIDGKNYAIPEPEARPSALTTYQFDIWEYIPKTLFDADTYLYFDTLTRQYQAAIAEQSADVRKRELERFVIELSWKSSKIEGNTYTLLDTERLLKDGVPSVTNSDAETQMILNHKSAFDFIIEHPLEKGIVTRAYIENVHTYLMKDLLLDIGWRKSSVGITGSLYRPLDNQFQIIEAVDNLIATITEMKTEYDKALLCLLGISYIQPFVDGNKRTARLIANALLLSGGCAPLSYRTVDEVHYRSALLAFYEQLSVIPMRELFVEQYEFASIQYR